MSLAQGLFSSFGQGVSMGQQSRRNDLLERQMLLQEEQANIKRVQQNANNEYNLASQNSWLNDGNTKLGQGFVDAVKSGNQDAQSQLMRLFNGSGMVAGGGEVTKITVDGDGIRGFVTNPDGTQGAITFGGSTENDAQTEVMPLDRLLDNANSLWNRNVGRHQTKIRQEEVNAWEKYVKSGAKASAEQEALFQSPEFQDNIRMINELNTLSTFEGDPVALRNVTGIINSAPTLEEKDEVTATIATDNNTPIIPVPGSSDSKSEKKGPIDFRDEPELKANLEKAKKAVKFRQKQFDEKPDGSGRASYLKQAKDNVTRIELMLEGKTREEANDIINTKNEENKPGNIAKRRMEASKNSPVSDEERREWMENNPNKLRRQPNSVIDEAIQKDKERDDKYINTESPKDAADNASSDEESVIQSDNEQVQMELTQAQSQFEGKSVKEIGQMAIDGEINLSNTALQEIAQKLQAAGVKEISDLKRLNNADRSLAMAGFAATIRPEDGAEFFDMANNILETGVASISGNEEKDFAQKQDSINQRWGSLNETIRKNRATLNKDVIGWADKLQTEIRAIKDNEDYKGVGEILSSASLNTYWNKLDSYDSKEFPQEHRILMQSMNQVLSQVVAELAQESSGTIWEKIEDLLANEDIDETNTGAADLFLDRVIIDSKGRLSYIEPPVIDEKTNKYVIGKMDRPFTFRELSEANSQVAQLVKRQATANSKKIWPFHKIMDKYIEDFYNAANKGRDAGVYTGARETPTVKRDGLGDAFDSGLRAGTLGLGSSIDYFQSLVGTVVGNEDMAERNIKEAQFGEALAGSALAGIEEFSETLENPTFKGALTQVSKFGGQGIPSLLYSVGSLATGGLVGGSIGVAGKTAAKKAAEKIVKDKISKAAAGKATAEEVAEAEIFYAIARDQAKKRGAKFGAFAGAGAAEYPSLAGENFGEALESGQERDRDTAFRSAAVAVPQTVIGVGTEAAFLKIIAKEARKRSTGKGSVFGQLAKAASVGGARGASLEGFSEYLQTEIGIQNRKSYDATYSQEEANLRRMEAAFAGAVIGGFAGGAGGIGTSAYQNREGAVAAGGVAQEKTKTVFNKAKKMWDDSVSKREFDRQEADAQEDVIILGQDEDSLTDQQREDLRKLQEQEQRESGQQRQSDLFDDEAYKEYNDLYKDDSLTTQQKDAINKINALPESFSISDFQLSMKIGFNPTLSLLKSLVEKKLITRNKDGKFTKVTDEPVRRDMRTSGRPDAYGNPQFPVTPGNVSSATAPESKNLETERVNFRAKVGENLASLAAADPKNTRLVSLEKQYRTSDDAGKDRILKTLYAEKTQIEVDKNTFLTDEDRSNDLVTDAQQAQAQDNSINETAEFETVATGEAKQDPSRVFENTASSRAAFIDTFSTEENPISFDNPFYAGMSESFLRTAVVEQNSNPDVEVNFSRDGNTYTAVVPNSANPKTPLLKTLKKASRTLKAKGSGVFLIDQDGNSKAIDLRVLTNAGVKILQERGDVDVYSLSPAERQALGLQTFLAEMQLAETFQDITFGGTQSLFDIDNTRSVRDQIPDNVVGGQVGTEELLLVDMLGSFESTGRSQPKYTVVRRDGPNVKFNSATEAQAFKDALEYGDGEQGIYIKKETYNLGPDEEDSVEFGVDEQTRANEQLQFPDEDTRQTDPIPLTTLNLEFGASNTPSKGEGRLNSSGQTGKTYQKPEYPFGELSNTVTRFLGRAATLIKPRKPVAVIGLKELQTFSNEDIVKKFNDPEAANFIQKAALDLQNTDGKLGEYFGFGNVHVVLIDNISVANDLQNSLVASHEALGHVLYQEELNASLAQPELRKRLERDFEKARTAKDAPFQYQGEYGFEEWYADQVAIKAKDIFFGGVKTNKKNTDKGLVARYFTKVVDKFKKLWSNLDSELRRRFGKENASQAFSDYMNNHIIKERAKYQAASTGPALKQISFKKKALVRSMEVAADTRAQQAMGRAVGKMSKLLDNAPGKVLLKLILAEDNILRGISPTIANMFYVQSNAEGMGSAVGFIKSKDHVKGQVFDQLEKMLGNNWDTKEVKDALREASSNTSTAEMKGKGREVRDWLDNFWEKYISKVPGNDIGKRENYFPVALNLIGIQQNPDAFVDFIVFNKPGVKRGDIIKIVDGLVARQSSIINEETEITFDATDPVSVIEKARELTDGIEASIPDEFVDPPEAALMKYIRHVVTRSEFKRATHDKDGTNLLEIELAKLPKDQKEQAVKVIERYLGYTKTPMNPKLQKLQSYIQLFNWVTLLPLATIGSIAELGGVIVNSRELRGFEFAAKAMKGNLQNREQVVQLARTIGVAWSTSMGNLGLTDADAEYLDPQVRKWSDKFFQVTMLDAFTRFTREFASATGVQFFLANADPKTASDRSTRYLEDHGVTAEQVNDWYSNQKEGEHFTFDGPEGEAVMAGLQRFVENSMLRPNAAERPGWANNPHYQLIWALKSYLYSFGKVIVGGLKREMGKRLGESNNVMDNMSAIGVTGIVAAVAFMPLAMLSLELRELAKASIAGVLPGVEPSGRYFRSDRMDYADYLGEMFDRAGYMGPLSIIGAMFKSQEWGQTGLGALFGPTVGLVVDDIGMGLYKGEGWDIVPSRIIPGYNLVL